MPPKIHKKDCMTCSQFMTMVFFSGEQWKKPGTAKDCGRRCIGCIDGKKKSVPLPANASAIANPAMRTFLSPPPANQQDAAANQQVEREIVLENTKEEPEDGASPKTELTAEQRARIERNRKEALKRKLDQVDLFGTMERHQTYGMGRAKQLAWDLNHHPLCTPDCPAYKKAGLHMPGCEHGLIKDAQIPLGLFKGTKKVKK